MSEDGRTEGMWKGRCFPTLMVRISQNTAKRSIGRQAGRYRDASLQVRAADDPLPILNRYLAIQVKRCSTRSR